LVSSGLSEIYLVDDQHALVSDLAIQCIRNSIVHGIETPEERKQFGKSVSGRIDLRLSIVGNRVLELVIKDDGYGIDVGRIKDAAAASGNWCERELESWSSKKLMSLIFESGLSTAASRSIDAGSGVGMNVIKNRVRKMRGKIRVQSRVGVGTRISVTLPLDLQSELAA